MVTATWELLLVRIACILCHAPHSLCLLVHLVQQACEVRVLL